MKDDLNVDYVADSSVDLSLRSRHSGLLFADD